MFGVDAVPADEVAGAAGGADVALRPDDHAVFGVGVGVAGGCGEDSMGALSGGGKLVGGGDGEGAGAFMGGVDGCDFGVAVGCFGSGGGDGALCDDGHGGCGGENIDGFGDRLSVFHDDIAVFVQNIACDGVGGCDALGADAIGSGGDCAVGCGAVIEEHDGDIAAASLYCVDCIGACGDLSQ